MLQDRKFWLIPLVLALSLTLSLFAQAYEAIEVKDGGALAGKVVFKGTVPGPRKVVITKDKEVCDLTGTGIREIPEIQVSSDNGVLNAVVLFEDVSKGKNWPGQEGALVINNTKCRFDPHIQVLPVGADVEVVNSDAGVLHNTHAYVGRRTLFNLALPTEGMRIKRSMPKKPGLVKVECDAHGWMLAWAHITDNPYYAITGEDGAFKIEDIPPGTYKVKVWHEYTDGKEQEVTIEAGKTTTLTVELTK